MPSKTMKKPPRGARKAGAREHPSGQGVRAPAKPKKVVRKPTKQPATRAGLYARVSTHDQQTLPMQVRLMRDYAKRRGWTVAAVVEDVGSGASQRPKREELIRAARRRELDVVVVWRLDRWGRSLVDLIGTLQELAATQVGFVSLNEALDLTTPGGRALAGMLAVFAEFERDILRERVRAGMAEARAAGKHLGRPAKVRAKHQTEVRRLFKTGASKRQIALKLGISRSSVRRLLEAQASRSAKGPTYNIARIVK